MAKIDNNSMAVLEADKQTGMSEAGRLNFNRKYIKNKYLNIIEANKKVRFDFLAIQKVCKSSEQDFFAENQSDKSQQPISDLTEQDKQKGKAKKGDKKETKPKKKKSLKRRILNKAIFALCAIVTGVFLGSWYYANVLSTNMDWNSYLLQLDEYEAKEEQTLNSALAKISNSQAATPLDLTLAENYQLANYNFENASQYIIQGTGKVSTITEQKIYSEKKYDGQTYQSISISSGLMKIAEIAQMNKTKTSVTTIKGQVTSDKTADWNGERNTYLAKDYKNLTGGLPSTSQNFIIAEQTVSNSLDGEITLIENEDGSKYYQFTMMLDPIYSVLNYINQIKYTSSLSSYPEFSSITQVVTIDENWNFVSISSTEIYSIVAYGMKNSCTGTLDNYFYFDQDVVIDVL